MSSKRINFICNDCDREFTNERAWQYHGESTGHNINGDFPSRETKELRAENAILLDEVKKLRVAYDLINKERANLAIKLDIVKSALQL